MKRVMKRITAFTLILVLGLSMVACGSKEDNGDESKGDSGKETKSGDNNTYTFSEYLNKGDDYQIWYVVDSLDKDESYHAIIIKDGKAACISGSNSEKYPKLGDVAQATDEEIYQEMMVLWRNQIDAGIEQLQAEISEPDRSEENIKMLNEDLDFFQSLAVNEYDFPEYTIGITTDATGNNTEEESFEYILFGYVTRHYDEHIDFSPLSSAGQEIYNSYYKGFYSNNNPFDSLIKEGIYFITRVDDTSVVITADEPGAEGVTVD